MASRFPAPDKAKRRKELAERGLNLGAAVGMYRCYVASSSRITVRNRVDPRPIKIDGLLLGPALYGSVGHRRSALDLACKLNLQARSS
jgi:hypothetical protein